MKRQCWICYGEEEEEERDVIKEISSSSTVDGGEWIEPCQCKGTTRWVHHSCLLSWLERTNTTRTGTALTFVSRPSSKCPQCHCEYRISEHLVLPRWILKGLDMGVRIKDKVLVGVTLGGVLGSLYLVAFGYGLAVVRVCGGSEIINEIIGLKDHLDNTWNMILFAKSVTGIPMVPLYVLSLRYRPLRWLYNAIPPLVFWERGSLSWSFPWPNSTVISMLPIGIFLYEDLIQKLFIPRFKRWLIPGLNDANAYLEGETVSNPLGSLTLSNSNSSTSVNEAIEGEDAEDEAFVISVMDTTATMILPFLSAAVGWLIAPRISILNRTIIGGAMIVVTRDILKTLFWYQKRTSNPRILNRK